MKHLNVGNTANMVIVLRFFFKIGGLVFDQSSPMSPIDEGDVSAILLLCDWIQQVRKSHTQNQREKK
ncbi:MAG: hypothetical protein WA071_24085 [Undibacterium umbellatum]|uniref:hypothetical protein n=1 Tax=Undibacterium umbellatum TaxID=2762300 RepID=UPI003BB6B34D